MRGLWLGSLSAPGSPAPKLNSYTRQECLFVADHTPPAPPSKSRILDLHHRSSLPIYLLRWCVTCVSRRRSVSNHSSLPTNTPSTVPGSVPGDNDHELGEASPQEVGVIRPCRPQS